MKNGAKIKPPEEWRLIPSLPLCEASDHGRIRTWLSRELVEIVIVKTRKSRWRPYRMAQPRLLRQTRSWYGGSPVVNVWFRSRKTKRSVNVLVCEVFVRQREVVINIDGNQRNNRPENLKWGSRSEAQQMAIARGHFKRVKLTAEKASQIQRRALSGERTCDLALEFGIKAATVSRIKRGEIWKSVLKPISKASAKLKFIEEEL